MQQTITLFLVATVIGTLLPSDATAQTTPLRDLIDAEIKSAWKKNNVTPAPRCSDAAFLRRIYLDLAGTVPTYEETQTFLKNDDPNKRQKLIDQLLDDPRYAVQQSDIWDQVLFGRDPPNSSATRVRDDFKEWLRGKFAKNVPYDQLVRELLLAEKGGPELFLVQYRNDAEETTVAVTRLFLGTQLQCARCHDHPYEDWTQRDFYGMAGFFARLETIRNGKGPGGMRRYIVAEKSTGDVMFTGPVTEQKPGQKGEPIKPKFLGGSLLKEPPLPKGFKEPDWRKIKKPPEPHFSRRSALAKWVTDPENPYFAKAIVNRLWGQFMGRGFVHPVDNLSAYKEPSHPELLKSIAEQIVQRKFDLKWLIRELVNTGTYQLASTGEVKDALPYWYERARVRPLSVEEMIRALKVVTGFNDAAGKNAKKARFGSNLEIYIERYLGTPTDGRGEFQASLNEHLLFNNRVGAVIRRKKGNLADVLLNSKASMQEKVDRLYLTVLTRHPNANERKRFVEYLSKQPDDADRIEDAIWVLVNCSEFRFVH